MNKNNITSYYKYCRREHDNFRYQLFKLNNITDILQRAYVAEKLMLVACQKGTGYYSHSDLEAPFLELAKTIGCKQDVGVRPNSFLHVLTEAYTHGGHTRVVERWIENAEPNQMHSVVLLKQGDTPIPDSLNTLPRMTGGNLLVLNDSDIVSRARNLREIAVEYEYIILHIHMYDATAIVAFGTEQFKRPVILLNHADHCYWCGYSVVDMVANIRDNDLMHVRGVDDFYTIRIPIDVDPRILNYKISRVESRRKLGIPLDKVMILTVGGHHKYQPFVGVEYCDVLSNVIGDRKDVICYGIGPDNNTGTWGSHGQQFVALGKVDYGEMYFDYLNACDIYINSMPIGGGTAILDAVQFRKPVLSYSPFVQPLEDLIRGVDTVYDKDQFERQLKSLVSSSELREQQGNRQYEIMCQNHGLDVWRQHVMEMLKRTPKIHSVKSNFFKGERNVDDLEVLTTLLNDEIKNLKTYSIRDVYHNIKMLFYKG